MTRKVRSGRRSIYEVLNYVYHVLYIDTMIRVIYVDYIVLKKLWFKIFSERTKVTL